MNKIVHSVRLVYEHLKLEKIVTNSLSNNKVSVQ